MKVWFEKSFTFARQTKCPDAQGLYARTVDGELVSLGVVYKDANSSNWNAVYFSPRAEYTVDSEETAKNCLVILATGDMDRLRFNTLEG